MFVALRYFKLHHFCGRTTLARCLLFPYADVSRDVRRETGGPVVVVFFVLLTVVSVLLLEKRLEIRTHGV